MRHLLTAFVFTFAMAVCAPAVQADCGHCGGDKAAAEDGHEHEGHQHGDAKCAGCDKADCAGDCEGCDKADCEGCDKAECDGKCEGCAKGDAACGCKHKADAPCDCGKPAGECECKKGAE